MGNRPFQFLRTRLALLWVPVIFTACSFSAKNENPSVSIDLSGLREQSQSLRASGSLTVATPSPTFSPGPPPNDVSGFACFGVNVTGPGINDSSRNPDSDAQGVFLKSLAGENHCAYRGIITPPMYLVSGGADASLQIPPGAVRLVQIVGITDPAICATGVIGNDDSNDVVPRYYEIGRAVLRDFYTDRSIGIASDWPALEVLRNARKIDCDKGNNAPFPVPVSLAVGPSSPYVSASTPTLQLTAMVTNADNSTGDVTSFVTCTAATASYITVDSTNGCTVTRVTGGGNSTQVTVTYTSGGNVVSTTVNVSAY